MGIKIAVLWLTTLILTACLGSMQENYYKSYADPITDTKLIALSDGQKPELIMSKNIEADKEKYQARGFVVIGQSEFENTGKYRALRRVRDSHAARAVGQAMKVSATHILYLRKKIDEYSTTIYNKKSSNYETEHFERYQNTAVYMVKRNNTENK